MDSSYELLDFRRDFMDLNIVEAEDRISNLPDSLLHYILSFLETRCVARTCILSKRWKYIWKSIPTLEFYQLPSLSEVNKFMDFVDRTLHLHDPLSSIQKFTLYTSPHINASRLHSWIENLTSRNVEDLFLDLHLDKPFFIPVSLFNCDSLTKLELGAFGIIHFPKSFSLPKLKILQLYGIQFTDDNCFNEQHFSNCPALGKLSLENCTWFGVRKFCISIPALKILEITNFSTKGGGLQDCVLKIYAPSLVSLIYRSSVAKDYELSSFVSLNDAEVYFDKCATREQWIGYGAAVSKLLRALSHVQSSLIIEAALLEVLCDVDDFMNNLPTFHNLIELNLSNGVGTEKLTLMWLKAAPNLKTLEFDNWSLSFIDDENECDETEGLFRRLQSVYVYSISCEKEGLRLAELILKNATSLQTMTLDGCAGNKKAVVWELLSLPRASGKCTFRFV